MAPIVTLVADLGIVHLGWFCVAVLLLNATPGPDTAFIVGQSVVHGRRAGLMSVLGITAGCVVHTMALALGLSALLAASATAFLVIKVAGALYLTFLGTRMIVATFRRTKEPIVPIAPAAEPRSLRVAPVGSSRRAFLQGLATNVSNPKVILFFLSFFPQFVDVASPSKGWAFVVLGVVLMVIGAFYNGALAWVAGSVTQRMRSAPRVRVWLERSIGAAFVALGLRIAVADH